MGEANRTRNHRVQVRLSDSEYDFFQYNLDITGLTAEAYLRKLIAEKTPKVKEISNLEKDVVAQLYAIGNNLNQISRRANSMGIINVDLFKKSVDEFERIMKKFLDEE